MKALRFGLILLACAVPLSNAAAKYPVPKPSPKPHAHKAVPEPPRPPEPLQDLSHAIPAKDAVKLPSTNEQFDTLRNKIVHDRPAVIDAKKKSDTLKAE